MKHCAIDFEEQDVTNHGILRLFFVFRTPNVVTSDTGIFAFLPDLQAGGCRQDSD